MSQDIKFICGSKTILPGVYQGMQVIPSIPASEYLDLTPGFAINPDGFRIEEKCALRKFVKIEPLTEGEARADLIVLRYDIKKPFVNAAEYRVLKGTEASSFEELTYNYPEYLAGDIVLAYVILRSKGNTAVTINNIYNLFPSGVIHKFQEISVGLAEAYGNKGTVQWQITKENPNLVHVTGGAGIIAGQAVNISDDPYGTPVSYRQVLYEGLCRNTIPLRETERHSHINITLSAVDSAINVGSTLELMRMNAEGTELEAAETLSVTEEIAAGTSKTFTSASLYSDIEEIRIVSNAVTDTSKHTIKAEADDDPCYLVAVCIGSIKAIVESRRSSTKYEPTSKELVLGKITADGTLEVVDINDNIEDGSITEEKLDEALKGSIAQISTNKTNIEGLTSSKANVSDLNAAVADINSIKEEQITQNTNISSNTSAISDLQTATVSTAKIEDKAVTKAKLEDSLQTSVDQIATNTSDITDLKNRPAGVPDNAVSTVKIQDKAVTAAKLATDAIKSQNYSHSGGHWSDTGTFLDTANGNLTSPYISWDGNGAYVEASVNIGKNDSLNLDENQVSFRDSNGITRNYLKMDSTYFLEALYGIFFYNSDKTVFNYLILGNGDNILTKHGSIAIQNHANNFIHAGNEITFLDGYTNNNVYINWRGINNQSTEPFEFRFCGGKRDGQLAKICSLSTISSIDEGFVNFGFGVCALQRQSVKILNTTDFFKTSDAFGAVYADSKDPKKFFLFCQLFHSQDWAGINIKAMLPNYTNPTITSARANHWNLHHGDDIYFSYDSTNLYLRGYGQRTDAYMVIFYIA